MIGMVKAGELVYLSDTGELVAARATDIRARRVLGICASAPKAGGFVDVVVQGVARVSPDVSDNRSPALEWGCDYCGCPNARARVRCQACGAPRSFLYRG